MAFSCRREPKMPAPVAYLIIRRRAENRLPACRVGIGLTSSDKYARDAVPLVVGAGVLKYPTNVKTSLDRGKHDHARCAARSDTGRCYGTWSAPLQPAWEELTMTDKTKTHDWSEAFWYRGKITRRR